MSDLIQSGEQADLVRAYFRAYEDNDRAALEAIVAPDFTFASPYDRIDRATYFTRCWPGHEIIRRFHIDRLYVVGDEVVVRYRAERYEGEPFHCTEFHRLRDGKVAAVDVYFGRMPADLLAAAAVDAT